jgi:hypothetical protein
MQFNFDRLSDKPFRDVSAQKTADNIREHFAHLVNAYQKQYGIRIFDVHFSEEKYLPTLHMKK